jgi:hypothetical protein
MSEDGVALAIMRRGPALALGYVSFLVSDEQNSK